MSISDIMSIVSGASMLIVIILNVRSLLKPSEDIQVRLAKIEAGIESIRTSIKTMESNGDKIESRIMSIEQRVSKLEAKHE